MIVSQCTHVAYCSGWAYRKVKVARIVDNGCHGNRLHAGSRLLRGGYHNVAVIKVKVISCYPAVAMTTVQWWLP